MTRIRRWMACAGGIVSLFGAAGTYATVDQPGTLDPFFATGSPLGAGKVATPLGAGSSKANALVVQTDGKVVLAGECSNATTGVDFCVLRYNANGTLDASFGAGGVTTTSFSPSKDTATAMALQPDGKIIVAGSCWLYLPVDSLCALRYNADGTLDSNFGVGGRVIAPVVVLYEYAITNAIAVQPDGKIVFAGHCTINGSDSYFCATRYSSTGTLDTGFGTGGRVLTAMGIGSNSVRAMALQTDGKLLLAGGCDNGSNNVFCALRYTTSGALDATFSAGGKLIDSGGAIGMYKGVAVQPDGKIVFANGCSAIVMSWICVTRYRTNGTIDPTFGTGGTVGTVPDINKPHVPNAITIQVDGKVLVAGYCGSGTNVDFCALRYNADGTPDANFGVSGKVLSPVGSSDDYAAAMVLQSDGKIVLAGRCSNGVNDDFCALRYDGGPFGYQNCKLDIDGDNQVLATTDALIHARLALGMTGNAVVNGISFPPDAARNTWPLIRNYLVTQCGMSLIQ